VTTVNLYNADECVFELQDGWRDQTVNMLSLEVEKTRYGFVINRDPLPEGKELPDFVEKHLKDISRKFRGFKIVGRREATIGGQPALEAKMQWLHDGQAMFHYQAFVVYYGVVMSFTATSRASHSKECERWMGEILSTLKFRR
jgi:hypothetical protein